MSYLDWKAGDKVVCLRGAGADNAGSISSYTHGRIGTAKDPRYPEKGKTYTLRNVNVVDDEDGYVLVLLEEIRNDHLADFIRCGLEPGFHCKHFRLAGDEQPA